MEVHDKPLPISAAHNLYLEGLYQDAKEVLHASEALFASLTPAQLTWKPGRKKWSILQCFDHLLKTNALYFARLQPAIEAGTVSRAEAVAPFKPSRFGKWFIGRLRPESKFKLKTFAAFKPDSRADDFTVTARFVAQQKQLLTMIKKADECDLNSIKIASPVSRLIKFSVGEALTVLVVHEQRHLLQAQNLQLLSGFPEFQA